MKRNAIARIILFSIGIVLLVGILGAVLLIRTYMIDHNYTEHHQEADHHQLIGEVADTANGTSNAAVFGPEIRNIEIDWVCGLISIVPEPKITEIQVIETNNSTNPMVCSASGSTLKIQYSKDHISFPSFGVSTTVKKDLIILVPENWELNKLQIDTASAQVEIQDMTIGDFDFDGASGTCCLTGCHVGTLDLDTASGDICFEGTLKHLDCDAASASCNITVSNVPDSIDIDTASGNLELYLPAECGFTCSTEGLRSSFQSDFETTTKNGHHIYGDGHCKIEVDAMSGDVIIRKHHTDTSTYCTDPNCTDSTHDHSGICTDTTCDVESHGHSNHH